MQSEDGRKDTKVQADRTEIARFNALAEHWWDRRGPMRMLHAMNPARTDWITRRIRRYHGIEGARVLDVGCGAGLLSENLARAGCSVLGVDEAEAAIRAAQVHAAGQGLDLAYRVANIGSLVAEGLRFPVVTALEVIEHVPDPQEFLNTLAALLEPGGLLFISTLNRTTASYVVAKLGAEYLTGMLPAGTHEWRRFIKPKELGVLCRAAGLRLADTAGLAPDLLAGGFRVTLSTRVNYIAMAVKGREAE
ncbi:MAG TPA: bifunctional 2-polyprenyl-6-hydroxyphenol methylase/3-demethylubiquinol 3-O-methyltransferase UbiG [Acetobacteraceae bacterium]|nr:bifunctional 2-polyprenyl-6-hydroxyphenol methylase/3-demethylubiquinol 3-O-methyltransferase UbiG [Acetobacteraceae bacterium]